MKLTLCVIVEGDKKLDNLKRLVSSVDKFVDNVCITANGGEDEQPTVETEAWCKQNGYNYSFLLWDDDFSAQRNFNFAQAPEDTDYIVWADSDDVIIGGEHLREIAEKSKERGYITMFFDYWYGNRFEGEPSLETLIDVELTQTRERLIAPKTMEWRKRLHESPIPLPGVDDTYSELKYSEEYDPEKGKYPIAWVHLGAARYGSEEQNAKRTIRNKRILEKQLQEERADAGADPRTLLYLMKIYAEPHHFTQDPLEIEKYLELCLSMGEEYLSKSGWDEERAQCCTMMSKCMAKLGDKEQATRFLHEAIREYPLDPLLYLNLSKLYFDQQNYSAMKHWMDVGLKTPMSASNRRMNNELEMKLLAAGLAKNYAFYAERNVRKAYKAAKLLYEIEPLEEFKKDMLQLYDLAALDENSERAHKLLKYYDEIGARDAIVQTIEAMPKGMRELPFANRLYNKYVHPRVWAKDEIAYFASFGQAHFEQWGPSSLEKGIGGSETAVIQLAKQWARMGYRVTVYGDPKQEEGMHDGVRWLPWYKFNRRDKFNILIQWRHNSLAELVSAKKFLVDLHDVWNEADYPTRKLGAIDALMVKSQYHKSLAPSIPDKKFKVISNGI